MHIHTHIHVLSLLSHSSLLTVTGTHRKPLASNQPTCYNEIHCTVNIMLAEGEKICLLTWSLVIHFEYELVELDFIQQILMTHGNI